MELSLAEAFIARVANRIMDSTVKLLLTHCDVIMADLGKCQQNCPVSGSAAPVKSRVKQGPVPHAAGCSDAIDRLFSWFCNVRVGLSAFRDAFAVAVPFAPWSLHSCGFCVSIGCESLRAGLGRAWRFISSALPCKIGPVFHSVGFSKDGTDTFSAGIRQAWQLSIPGQSVPFRSALPNSRCQQPGSFLTTTGLDVPCNTFFVMCFVESCSCAPCSRSCKPWHLGTASKLFPSWSSSSCIRCVAVQLILSPPVFPSS